jgi:hypothetical protein
LPTLRACERFPARSRKLPVTAKKFPAGARQFPAPATQGIRLNPLQQWHKAVCESPESRPIFKNSLQNSLRAGKPPARGLRWLHMLRRARWR